MKQAKKRRTKNEIGKEEIIALLTTISQKTQGLNIK